MAKQNLKTKSWVCEHGCLESKEPCKHLERSLPSLRWSELSLEDKKAHYEDVMSVPVDRRDIETMASKLEAYGLPEHEVDLILDRYISNLSLKEIAEKHGYLSKQQVWRMLQETKARLSKSDNFKRLLKGN